MFSAVVTNHWNTEGTADAIRVVIDPTLANNRSVSVLTVAGGVSIATMTPERAAQLAITGDEVTPEQLATLTLNDPDHIFYLPESWQATGFDENTRQLTPRDSAAFERFTTEAPDSDVDDAFVELDHWLVFGTFVENRLVAAASMYPWGGTRLADLGVLTLPEVRGQGHGTALVRAISARARELGYEPQYRCQLDNAPSIVLAEKVGFELFGDWRVILSD